MVRKYNKKKVDKLIISGTDYYSFDLGDSEIFEPVRFINSQNLDFSDGNIFKAICRIASHKQGVEKKGNTIEMDYQKIIFFANNQLNRLKTKKKTIKDNYTDEL